MSSEIEETLGIGDSLREEVARAWSVWGEFFGLSPSHARVLMDMSIEGRGTALPPGYRFAKREGRTVLLGDLASALKSFAECTQGREVWACRECGSTNVQGTAWIELNTGILTGGDSPLDELWCPGCSTEVRFRDLEDISDAD